MKKCQFKKFDINISDLYDDDFYHICADFKEYGKFYNLSHKQSKNLYSKYSNEAEKRVLDNFPMFEELLICP